MTNKIVTRSGMMNETIPMISKTVADRNQNKDPSLWEVMARKMQMTSPATIITPNNAENMASVGSGTVIARPPNIIPINPFTRHESFASMTLPQFLF
jgi:hypothetical protein